MECLYWKVSRERLKFHLAIDASVQMTNGNFGFDRMEEHSVCIQSVDLKELQNLKLGFRLSSLYSERKKS